MFWYSPEKTKDDNFSHSEHLVVRHVFKLETLNNSFPCEVLPLSLCSVITNTMH
jgi:glycine cleavage system protein P-like pyridoxal-binding family